MKKKFICSVAIMMLVGILFSGCGKKDELEVEITCNGYNLVEIA